MNKKISKKDLQDFGILLGITFPILLGLFLPFLYGHKFQVWTLYVGGPFLFLGIFKPQLLIYFYKAWMKLGLILGWINSRLILGLIYIFIVQPIAIIMRIFGYDPLQKKTNNNKSYREVKNNSIDFTRIF